MVILGSEKKNRWVRYFRGGRRKLADRQNMVVMDGERDKQKRKFCKRHSYKILVNDVKLYYRVVFLIGA